MVNARNAIHHGTTRLNGHPAHQHTFPTAHASAPADITIVNVTLCSFTTQRVTTQNQRLPSSDESHRHPAHHSRYHHHRAHPRQQRRARKSTIPSTRRRAPAQSPSRETRTP